MNRPRLLSSRTLALPFGAVLVVAAFMLIPTSVGRTTSGCESVELTPPPDASLPECNRGPFTFFCQPAPAAGQPACNTSASSSPLLARLPQNTDYPVGCVVNFVGARDPQGDCSLEAVCKCVEGEISAPPPVDDAGAGEAGTADGGEDGGAQPEPAPRPTVGPTWLCSP